MKLLAPHLVHPLKWKRGRVGKARRREAQKTGRPLKALSKESMDESFIEVGSGKLGEDIIKTCPRGTTVPVKLCERMHDAKRDALPPDLNGARLRKV